MNFSRGPVQASKAFIEASLIDWLVVPSFIGLFITRKIFYI